MLSMWLNNTLMEACRGPASLPFAPGKNGRVRAKLVDDWGIKCLRILEIA